MHLGSHHSPSPRLTTIDAPHAAANVLMAESEMDRRGWESKVTDFGFARVVATNHVHTKAYGTVTHMPPELLEKGLLTTATDVFSLGMLMWEVRGKRDM